MTALEVANFIADSLSNTSIYQESLTSDGKLGCTSWHPYGCGCSHCHTTIYQTYPVISYDAAAKIERKAMDKVIEAIRKQKSKSPEVEAALSILDGVRELMKGV